MGSLCLFIFFATEPKIAEIRTKAKEVANDCGWSRNKKLGKKNARDVYTDSDGNNWSVDSQHGRLEKLDKRGRHQGEYDMDLKPTKPADSSGVHHIKI